MLESDVADWTPNTQTREYYRGVAVLKEYEQDAKD